MSSTPQQGTSGGVGAPRLETPSNVQRLLDENAQLIKCIGDDHNAGRVEEQHRKQQLLHRNLIYLAKFADASLVAELMEQPVQNGEQQLQQGLAAGAGPHSAPSPSQQQMMQQQQHMQHAQQMHPGAMQQQQQHGQPHPGMHPGMQQQQAMYAQHYGQYGPPPGYGQYPGAHPGQHPGYYGQPQQQQQQQQSHPGQPHSAYGYADPNQQQYYQQQQQQQPRPSQ
ncbi:hypothetical protein PRIPAC_85413 [Pristionchus pacificus]|uniref:Uncharacterized protein n=1 Tax=Pristionchus pacificus TaxID=54126 RepID=A0A454XZH6_PRIPA|nr:hypothetical protein PRIPAC_85413 [Pristionchus pacificus]|eukprot:PDM69031.1 hypothetical protein PRIPAC_47333 [Pristionchus pacificus]